MLKCENMEKIIQDETYSNQYDNQYSQGETAFYNDWSGHPSNT